MPCLQETEVGERTSSNTWKLERQLFKSTSEPRIGLLLTLPFLAPGAGAHSPLPPSRLHICSLHPCRRAGINYRAGKGRAAPGLARGTSSSGRRARGTALEAGCRCATGSCGTGKEPLESHGMKVLVNQGHSSAPLASCAIYSVLGAHPGEVQPLGCRL